MNGNPGPPQCGKKMLGPSAFRVKAEGSLYASRGMVPHSSVVAALAFLASLASLAALPVLPLLPLLPLGPLLLLLPLLRLNAMVKAARGQDWQSSRRGKAARRLGKTGKAAREAREARKARAATTLECRPIPRDAYRDPSAFTRDRPGPSIFLLHCGGPGLPFIGISRTARKAAGLPLSIRCFFVNPSPVCPLLL
jgi:hypothetical protein